MPIIKNNNLKNAQLAIWKLSEALETLEKIILKQLNKNDKKIYQNFKNEKRKKEWIATRILLKKIKKSPYAIPILYNDENKPFLIDENISISHSRDYVALIVSKIKQVGVDIEKISNKPFKVKNKFLNSYEQNNFDISKEKITTLMWSIKECVYKFYGKKNLSFINAIKIMKNNIKEKGTMKILLFDEINLIVNYEFFDNNVLTYI